MVDTKVILLKLDKNGEGSFFLSEKSFVGL